MTNTTTSHTSYVGEYTLLHSTNTVTAIAVAANGVSCRRTVTCAHHSNPAANATADTRLATWAPARPCTGRRPSRNRENQALPHVVSRRDWKENGHHHPAGFASSTGRLRAANAAAA